MKLINPDPNLEYITDVHFDKENKKITVQGFNSECIMDMVLDFNHKIIRDMYQPITKKRFNFLLEQFKKNPENVTGIIMDNN